MTVIQWAPQIGHERRTFPSTNDSWAPTTSPVARYLLHLRALGIEDPTKATEAYRNALDLREHVVSVATKPDEDAAITSRLARGEISPEEAEKRLAKVTPRAAEVQEQVERTRQAFATATRQAYVAAVLAVHDYGDKWLDLLRPLVQEAVAARDDARFEALHRFAALLRSPDLAALAMVASDTSGNREFDERWRYKVGRPDLYHAWRFERAEQTHNAAHINVGTAVFVGIAVTKGPHPTLADMVEGQMEPGIYSAAEVVSITGAILAEQEAAQVSAEPVPPRRSRAEVSS